MHRFVALAAGFFLATPALAFNGETVTELSRGSVRDVIRIRHDAPDPAAWSRFLDTAGGRWRVFWDADKGTPTRIFGSGIAAPGSVSDKDAAARFATAALTQHLDLFAPGAKSSDFVLVSNVEFRGVRSVGFIQHHRGFRVEGGQISFRFKHDRLIAIGVEAFGELDVRRYDRSVSHDVATEAAQVWLAEIVGVRGVVESIGAPFVNAVPVQSGGVVAEVVRRVIVRTPAPIGRWAIDIVDGTGERFALRQTLMFFEGTVGYHVPARRPGVDMLNRPAVRAALTVNGDAASTDDLGLFSWTATGAAQVVIGARGERVNVNNENGLAARTTLQVEDGATVIWDPSDDEEVDAQIVTFVASHGVRDFMKTIAPNLRFLDQQLEATVNIDDQCNAFSDGTTINFFRSSDQCENTGRLTDVVHHEYGHAVHAHAVIPGVGSFDSSLSEGGSDYLAATMVNDPAMGIGFFRTDEPLRHLDPEGREARYPEDRGESHVTGLIIGGALWDLRKVMVATYGPEAGVDLVDRWWYATFQRSSNILTAYVEVLVEDDDDGNLDNGTPNVCAISAAFSAHGIAEGYQPGPALGELTFSIEDDTVRLPVGEGTALCPGAEFVGAQLTFTTRGSTSEPLTVDMPRAPGGFEFTIPKVPEGNVLEYRVSLEYGDGTVRSWPRNPASPMYEVFVGEVTPLYCTDFEDDPEFDGGWTHQMTEAESSRARDEWEWGFPAGLSGDPIAAYSGGLVFGQDLGNESNGRYQGRKTEVLRAPPIEVTGQRSVRLQYRRWLTVQDGSADQAEILAYGTPVWANAATPGGDLHHIDYEWRFHDIDLTELTLVNGGRVDVAFSLTSDRFFSFGGWTIDDFCIVSWNGPVEVCGDGTLQGNESCDDGNQLSGDGCEADCTTTPAPVCGNGVLEAGESCDDGNVLDQDGCEATCLPTPEPKMPTLAPEEDSCSCTSVSSGRVSWTFGAFAFALLLVLRRRR